MNIFDRIAAAVLLIQKGQVSNPDYDAHLKAIDEHLADADAHEAADARDAKTRLDAIEAGLNTIADAVAPEAPADPAPQPDQPTE